MLRKGLLIPAGLVVALLVPSVAFGGIVNFTGTFPKDGNAKINFHVQRVGGKNKTVTDMSVRHFNVNCTKSGKTEIQTNKPITINAAVQNRKWQYDDGVTSFAGTFRKGDKNKADGTLEVTLTGINFGNGKGPETCHGGPRVFHAHH